MLIYHHRLTIFSFFFPCHFIALCESVVDDVDVVLPLSDPNQIVVRLNVTMEETTRVDILNPLDQLVSQHEDRVQRELSMTVIEEVFKTRT